MKTILVATDFSKAATNAARYASQLAAAINANLVLLHVYQIPVTYIEIPVAVNIDDSLNDAEMALNELKEQLSKSSGPNVKISTKVKMGVFFQELKMLCEQLTPFVVVMGSQGSTAGERLILGAHTTYAMRYLNAPLIAVPPTARFSSVKKIGLACDFSKVMESVPIDEIKILVNDFNARLHVLNTSNKEAIDPELVFQSALLQEMLLALNPAYHFIVNENIDEGIMDFAEINHIDLLIVLHKRHSLLNNILHKSHTKNMILHSHVPVLALHD